MHHTDPEELILLERGEGEKLFLQTPIAGPMLGICTTSMQQDCVCLRKGSFRCNLNLMANESETIL